MKIQISTTKKVEDAIVIWDEPGDQVDICIDTREKGLPFRPATISVIYAFGILGKSKPNDVKKLIASFFKALTPSGQLYIIENDFEYINRAIMGGDLCIKEFNKSFRRDGYFDQNLLIEILENGGFPRKDQRIWRQEGIKFKKEHYELIISGTKPKK